MLIADRKCTEAQNKTVSIQPPPPPSSSSSSSPPPPPLPPPPPPPPPPLLLPPTVCSLHSVVAHQQSWVVSRHHRQSPVPFHAPHPQRVGQIGQGGSQNYSENLQECVCVCNGVCCMIVEESVWIGGMPICLKRKRPKQHVIHSTPLYH